MPPAFGAGEWCGKLIHRALFAILALALGGELHEALPQPSRISCNAYVPMSRLRRAPRGQARRCENLQRSLPHAALSGAQESERANYRLKLQAAATDPRPQETNDYVADAPAA